MAATTDRSAPSKRKLDGLQKAVEEEDDFDIEAANIATQPGVEEAPKASPAKKAKAVQDDLASLSSNEVANQLLQQIVDAFKKDDLQASNSCDIGEDKASGSLG